jgi:[acyl-carrier-protein] S-malonyltransferase
MEAALATANLQNPSVPLVANVTASTVRDAVQIRSLLVEQVTGQVRWRESVEYMAAEGVTSTIEIGVGKVLTGLVKRIAKDLDATCIASPQDIDQFAKVA